MAARTYKEWWAKNSYKYFWAECVAETIWNAAITSLEGVQTQTTNISVMPCRHISVHRDVRVGDDLRDFCADCNEDVTA